LGIIIAGLKEFQSFGLHYLEEIELMVVVESVVQNEVGLHARPAAVFVQAASRFESKISIRNMKDNRSPVNAKSILQVLLLGVCQGDRVEIAVEGKDEAAAAETLKTLIDTDFAGHL
jgi:phosphotransferase system HPr (HPr) family protein